MLTTQMYSSNVNTAYNSSFGTGTSTPTKTSTGTTSTTTKTYTGTSTPTKTYTGSTSTSKILTPYQTIQQVLQSPVNTTSTSTKTSSSSQTSFTPTFVAPHSKVSFNLTTPVRSSGSRQPSSGNTTVQEVTQPTEETVTQPIVEIIEDEKVLYGEPELLVIPITQDPQQSPAVTVEQNQTKSAEGFNYTPWIVAGVAGLAVIGAVVYAVRSK